MRSLSRRWSQHEGVGAMNKTISVVERGPGALWVKMTWPYAGGGERFCYRLLERTAGLQIAVLSLLH